MREIQMKLDLHMKELDVNQFLVSTNMSEKVALAIPKFIKVKDIEHARSGYNVYVKIVSVQKRQIQTRDGKKIPMVDAVVADQTGSAKAFFKGDSATIIEKDNVVAIRNGVKRFIKNFISLEIDLFGRITLEKNINITSSTTNNISEVEHKLDERPKRERRDNRPHNRQGDNRRQDNRQGDNRRQDNRRDHEERPRNNDRRGGDREDRRGGDREERRGGDHEERKDRVERKDHAERRQGQGERRQGQGERRDQGERRNQGERRDNERRDNGQRKDYGPRRDNGPRREQGERRDYVDRRDNEDKRQRRNNDRDLDRPRRQNRRQNDRDFDRTDRGDRNNRTENRPQRQYQEKREQNRDRRAPFTWNKIADITPGEERLNINVKVISAQKVGTRLRCVIGDETGIANAFLPESEHLYDGEHVVLFNARSEVVKEHIEIQLDRKGRVDKSRRDVANVKEDYNLSQKAWVPIE